MTPDEVNPLSAALDRATATLGSPAVARSDCRVYAGDCLELLRGVPDGTVDLVVTSPPYNIGKAYEAPLPIPAYLDWCERWAKELHRVLSPRGAFWLNLGYFEVAGRGRAVPIPYLLWDRIPFYLIQEIVWNYGAGVAARLAFSPRNEKFLWWVKDPENYTFNLDAVRDPDVKYPNQRKNGKLKVNPLGKNPSDVWQFPKVTSGTNRASKERTDHPAQFPIAVVERIVLACSNPGDLVLDPFMGSGSTAEVCLRTGRASLGFEIKPEYVETIDERLRDYLDRRADERSQGGLFSGIEG